ncbi:MAG TPA: TrkA family potassium uptake protein [Herpetosiphonaceae bacterium]|nr:TrkA family potassium uptake protein [Herpetosiphonaceae bacterium]
MRAIVVGCGRVGSLLVQLLEQDEHQVVVVDKDAGAFRRLHAGFRGRTVTGVGFDRDTLREAGIERADAFAAVTSGDNSNFVAASVARDTFRVPTVVARIYDPQREQIYRRLGIRTISSTAWGAQKLKRLLEHTDLHGRAELGNGEVELIEARISSLVAGRSVRDLSLPNEALVFAVVRAGQALIPTPGTILEEGDTVHLSVDRTAINTLESLLR